MSEAFPILLYVLIHSAQVSGYRALSWEYPIQAQELGDSKQMF
jgi:hypothetical protein